MQKIKRNIPNTLTCGNLLCGCFALVKAFEGNLIFAAYLVGIALVFDFLDGFTARLLKASSPIGKDLDSLADMVTFGVVPGVIMFQLLKSSLLNYYLSSDAGGDNQPDVYPLYFYVVPYLAFLLTMFSAVRLARFNNDTRQTDSFIGMPTPANAVFFASIPLITQQITSHYETTNPLVLLVDASSDPLLSLLNNPFVLVSLIAACSFLLIAPIPLFALKFKSFSWKGNEIRFTFLGLTAILLILFKYSGIPLALTLYILFSIVNNVMIRRNSN